MNTKKILLLACLLLLVGCGEIGIQVNNTQKSGDKISVAKAPQNVLPDQFFLDKYNYWRDKLQLEKGMEQYIKRAEKEYKDNHIQEVFQRVGKLYGHLLFERSPVNEHASYNPDTNPYVIEIRQYKGVVMTFYETGELRSIENHLIDYQTDDARQTSDDNAKLSNGQFPKPQRTEVEMMAKAQGYLSELDKERIGEYTFTKPGISVSYRAPLFWVWNIHRRRILNGYEFEADYISLELTEKNDIWHYFDRHESEDCPTNVKISPADAEQTALEVARKINNRNQPEIEKEHTELEIVNPDYNFSNDFIGDNLQTRKSRLAYSVYVKWCAPNISVYDPKYVHVEIDAEQERF